MVSNKQDIAIIETYLHGLFKSVSEHTYVGKLPDTIKSGWTDMLLIDIGNGVYDLDAYGSGTVLLFAYAKPRSDGSKNVTKLKSMEASIDTIIEQNKCNGDYSIYRRKTYSDYDYSRNWHCDIVSLGITVK